MDKILSHSEQLALIEHLGLTTEEAVQETPEKFDLTDNERITRGRLPGIDLVYDRLGRSLRNSFTKYLGTSCLLRISVRLSKFGPFSKTLTLPSHLHLFRLPPLPGQGLLFFSNPFVFAVTDLLFGGKGRRTKKLEGREFTAIENRLMAKAAMLILESLKEAWEPIFPVEPVYARNELNPLALTIATPSDLAVIADFAVDLTESEPLTLAICTPYSMLEPIKGRLTQEAKSPQQDQETNRRVERQLKKAEVTLRVQLASGKITLRDLLALKINDTIPLASHMDEPATIFVEGKPKFQGTVGVKHGSKAVQIKRTISPE